MKILQVTPFYWPVSGGVEEAAKKISEELVRRGHEVHVYTTLIKSTKREEVLNSVYIHRFPVCFSIGSFANFWPTFVPKLLKDNFDIVHAHVYRHPHTLLSLFITKMKREKSILSTHAPFHPAYVWGRLQHLVKLYDSSVGKITNVFDAVFMQSSFESQYMKRLGVALSKVYLIPNGVDEKHFINSKETYKEKTGVKEDFILYLGKLHKTKGLDFLLQAFNRVLQDGYNIKLIAAGKSIGSYESYLKMMASELGISNNVIFAGPITESKKISLLCKAKFFVLPSIFEPFGIVLLEAMAHRKPVIATKHGGPPDFVKDGYNGFLINYGDVNDLASKMKMLLNDKKLSYLMGVRAQKIATVYKWPRIVSKIERIYETLTER